MLYTLHFEPGKSSSGTSNWDFPVLQKAEVQVEIFGRHNCCFSQIDLTCLDVQPTSEMSRVSGGPINCKREMIAPFPPCLLQFIATAVTL